MSVTLWRWALGTCMLLVLVLSLLPPSPQLPTTGWDKSNHVLAFAVLAFLSEHCRPRHNLVALAGLLAYGGLIEVLQSSTPYRAGDSVDLFADAVGLAIGVALAKLAFRCLPR